jgi:hypothetical protein
MRDETSVFMTLNDVGVAHFSMKPLTVASIPIQFRVYSEKSHGVGDLLVSSDITFYSQTSELLMRSTQPEVTAMLCQWKPTFLYDWALMGSSIGNLRTGEYTITFRRPGEGRNVACVLKSGLEVYVAPFGAQWKLYRTGYDSGWQNSGYLLEDLAPETYTATFSEVAGWTKPADQTVVVPSEDQLVLPDDRIVRVSNGVKTSLTQDFDLEHLGCLTAQYAQL